MTKEFVTQYFFDNWFNAGLVCGGILVIFLWAKVLKKNGYLDIDDLLLASAFYIFCIVIGWLNVLAVVYFFKDPLIDAWNKFRKVKIIQTKQYKTKTLLYKDEDEPEF